MFIYIFLLVMVLTIFLYREMVLARAGSAMLYHKSKPPKAMLYMVMGILLFIATFRADHIGADHNNYVTLFQSIPDAGTLYFVRNGEVGYVLLNKIAYFFSGEAYSLNFFAALVLMIGFVVYARKHVDPSYWWMALLIFVLHPYLYIQSTFNAMRQGCAMGVAMLAMCVLKKEKIFWFVVLTVAAGTFHKSAYSMLLLLIVRKMNWSAALHKVIAFAMFILNFLPTSSLIAVLSSALGYDGYTSYEASFLNNKLYVVFVAVLLFTLLQKYDKLYLSKDEKLFVDLFLLSVTFLLIAVKNDMFYRIYIYLAYLSIPGITIICKNAKRFISPAAIVRYTFVAYYTSFYVGYLALLWLNQNERYIPFQFIWNI